MTDTPVPSAERESSPPLLLALAALLPLGVALVEALMGRTPSVWAVLVALAAWAWWAQWSPRPMPRTAGAAAAAVFLGVLLVRGLHLDHPLLLPAAFAVLVGSAANIRSDHRKTQWPIRQAAGALLALCALLAVSILSADGPGWGGVLALVMLAGAWWAPAADEAPGQRFTRFNIAGLLATGVLVMLGWWTHAPLIVQGGTASVPTQFNTAVSLVLCAVALVLASGGRRAAALVAMAPAALAAIGTMIEEYSGTDLGLDQALFAHRLVADGVLPGRMAPNTAAALLLLAIGIALYPPRPVTGVIRHALTWACGLVVANIAGIVLAAYLIDLPSGRSWNLHTPMALMTAVGLAFAGLALARIGVGERREQAQSTVWLPILVAVGMSALSASLWFALSRSLELQARHAVEQDAAVVARNIADNKRQRIDALRRMAMRLASSTDVARQQGLFRIDANIYLLDFPSLASLVWLDAQGRPVERVDRLPLPATGLPLVPSAATRHEARPDPDVGLTGAAYLPPELRGNRLLQWVQIPIVAPDGSIDGHVLGLFDVGSLLQRALANVDTDRPLRIGYGAQPLFVRGTESAAAATTFEVPVGPVALQLALWPSEDESSRRLPSILLFTGLVLGGLLAISLRLAALARLRADASAEAEAALRWQMAERERTQARLDETHAELAAIIEGIGDGFVMLDTEWRFTYLNARAEVILHRQREELLGRNCWDEFPEAVGTEMQRTYERAVREQATAAFETYYPPLDAWLEIRAHPHPRGLAVYFQDISERQRQREALDRSREALTEALRSRQLIMDSSLDVICSFDPLGRFVEVSAASELVWGYRPDEMIGRTYFDFVHPDDIDTTRHEAAAIMAGQPTLDFRNRFLDREGRPVHMQWSAVWSAEAQRTFCVARDVTELERRKAALLEVQESLLRAQEIARLGSWELDLANDRLAWSGETFAIFGVDPAAFDGRFSPERVHPDDRGPLASAMAATRRGEGDLDFEHRILRPDGEIRHVHERARLLRDATGQPRLLSGTVQDISERKRQEALAAGQRDVLEAIAARRPLAETLAAITRLYEAQRPGALCSVLLIEDAAGGPCLRHGAAPSLPDAYNRAIDNVPIGDYTGSCGTAAWRGEQVIVTDIAHDPLWADYRDLAAEHGLGACWSTPVRDSRGRVAATFAVYYRTPQAPAPGDLQLVDGLSALVGIAVEQARAFRDVQLSEQRFRSLFEEHPDAVYAMDLEGRFTSCNAGFEAMTGARAQDVIGKTFDDLVAPEQREFVRQRFDRAAAGEAVNYETVGRTPQGRHFETRVTNLPIVVEGEVVGVYGVAHDISPLRRHQRELAEALARSTENSLMLRRLSQAAIMVNRQLGKDVDIRQELVDLLRDVVGAHQAVLSLTRGDDWAQSINAVSLSEKYAAWRDYAVPPDGSGIYAVVGEQNRAIRMTQEQLEAHPRWRGFGKEAKAHPPMRGWLAVPLVGPEGQVIGILQLSDKFEGEFTEADELVALQFAQMAVTAIERARLIDQLRERDRFFDLSAEVFVIYQPGSQRWLQVNPMFSQITGYSREELLSRDILEFLHPDDREVTRARSSDLAAGRPVVNSFANRYVCKDGSLRWMEWVSAPAPDGVVYAVGRDITQRRQAEEALQQTLADLRSRNRELQDFAFVASHDLQEPLRKIRAFSDRLASRYRDALEAQARDYLDRMNQAAARMQGLIDDLLAYSRVSTRAKPFAPVNLGGVCAEVLGDLEARIEQSQARVELDELPTINADAMQMRQLFQNLLANALKFHAPGRPPRVTIHAEPVMLPVGPGVRLTFADNGIGFEEKYAERIFTPFQRLHARAEYEGTGIGLAIVRRIVERHRGQVVAHGEPGVGARFVIDLPLQPPPETLAGSDDNALPESSPGTNE